MSSNFKYQMQKHQSKILMGVAGVSFVGIIGGLYFLTSGDGLFKNEVSQQFENKLAKYMVTGTTTGEISLYEIETSQLVSTFELPDGFNYVYATSNNYETLYVYNGEKLIEYEIKGKEIIEKEILLTEKIDGVSEIKVSDNDIAFVSNNGQTINFLYGEDSKQKEIIQVQDNVSDFYIEDGTLYYSSNTNLYAYNKETSKVIGLGDVTDTIRQFGDQLIIHNEFGSSLNNNALMSVEKETLKINYLTETKSANTKMLPMDEDDTVFYTSNFVQASEPYNLLESWYIKDGKIIKDEDVTVKIPVGIDSIEYNDLTTIGSDGYLYTKTSDDVQIFDIRSQSVSYTLDTQVDFIMPVLNK